jgi:hypothetical protein
VDLVAAIISALRDEALNVRSATWLAFANLTAGAASAAAIGTALERFVSSFARDLPEGLGDGPWRTDLNVSGGRPEEVVAGLLWLRLGSPEAGERWRACHAIRRLVDLGCADVVFRLMRKFESRSAGAFQDRSLPFFFLHARLWLLITLARITQDQPSTILPLRSELANIAFGAEFPHAIMRHFASAALRSLAASLDDATERETLLERLSLVNVSPFPRAKGRQPGNGGNPWARPKDIPEPDPPFLFDYDFTKYKVDRLGRVFDCAAWQVNDVCVTWIREWSDSVPSMHDCPRAARGFDRNNYWRWSSDPQRDRWGTHLAWHALMLTAGQFLARRAVSGNAWEEEPWRSWIAGELLSRSDGLWLADGTDLFPPELRHPVAESNCPGEVGQRDMPAVPSDPGALSALVGLEGKALGQQLIVDGWWPSTDGIDVTVHSVLADPRFSYDVALAVAAAKPIFQWLPPENDQFAWQTLDEAGIPIRAWTTASPPGDPYLDRHDPYAASTALKRPRPTESVIGALDLAVGDPIARVWRHHTGEPAFCAEAWGATGGAGEYAWDKAGFRMFCRAQTLLELLSAKDTCLVLLVKAQKYLKDPDTYDGRFVTSTLLVTITPSGGVEFVIHIPDRARTAIEALGPDEQHDFVRRFEAIRNLSG